MDSTSYELGNIEFRHFWIHYVRVRQRYQQPAKISSSCHGSTGCSPKIICFHLGDKCVVVFPQHPNWIKTNIQYKIKLMWVNRGVILVAKITSLVTPSSSSFLENSGFCVYNVSLLFPKVM